MREIVKDKGRVDARFRFWDWSEKYVKKATKNCKNGYLVP